LAFVHGHPGARPWARRARRGALSHRPGARRFRGALRAGSAADRALGRAPTPTPQRGYREKKYLLAARGVPEEAILVDPHARHTTTNLRNASRLLYRGGVPTDRPLLVTSDFAQSLYIGYWHGTFGPRCQDELGYLPWRSLVPLSQNDTCMRPVAVSLHGDGRDPLDP
jgi:hypothetical protein